MNSLSASQIRQAFVDYFRKHDHELVPSSSLIPDNDPTLLFVNAGMVQFKDVFTGRATRPYSRATSCQKCMRISGKHNDLENVGRTARHHTFFEMLGNFSFGDYFKEQAIVFAWEFLTKELQLPRERLAITVFGGENDISADDEAREWWKKVSSLPDERIRGFGLNDNFWQMGDTGPCGPCSEVYFFVGDNVDPALLGTDPDDAGRGWMEIWNLVFMQFERQVQKDNVILAPLPRPCVDTGAGLERLCAVMQGARSNYDTNLLLALVKHAGAIASKTYTHSQNPDDTSMRVIADHARSTAFLIADGVLPDRDGRSYVLRRLMRRAIRHGHRLGITEPFFHQIALDVVRSMGDHYPELRQHERLIADITEQEEVRFRKTLDNGLRLLEDQFAMLLAPTTEQSPGQTPASSVVAPPQLSGEAAFKLYDTFGFPLDLTEVICQERGVGLDRKGYDRALSEAQARSKGSDVGDKAVPAAYFKALERVPEKQVNFVGYTALESPSSKVVALVVDGALVQQTPSAGRAMVVLDITPFYGESGGQQGDVGTLVSEGRVVATVTDTQKPLQGLFIHDVLLAEPLRTGQQVLARVDETTRAATRRNHTATHLLHFALRKVLGDHATQKGSLVGPERLRFDFTHAKALTAEQLIAIEDLVNEKILQNAPVQTQQLGLAQARELGAIALFGEKYGDWVRVVTMTDESIELCGGTHASATGDVGMFKIVSENGIAAGVRRIEAVTGIGALALFRATQHQLETAARALKADPQDVPEKITKLLQREKELEKKINAVQRQLSMGASSMDDMLAKATQVGDVNVLALVSQVADPGALRDLADKLRDKLGNAVVVVGGAADNKAMLVVTVSKPLTTRIKAGEVIRQVAQIVGGKGGGRPDMAQAGGHDVAKLPEAIAAVTGIVKAIVEGK